MQVVCLGQSYQKELALQVVYILQMHLIKYETSK